LEAIGKVVGDEPCVHHAARTDLASALTDLFSMSGAVVVDVIYYEELRLGLAATSATRSIVC
jgi:hypothetical protein